MALLSSDPALLTMDPHSTLWRSRGPYLPPPNRSRSIAKAPPTPRFTSRLFPRVGNTPQIRPLVSIAEIEEKWDIRCVISTLNPCEFD